MALLSSTVLVTGASGFLGRAVVRHLAQRGFQVRGAVRATPRSGEVAIGNFSALTDWSQALDGLDTVIHCAAMANARRGSDTDFMEVNGRAVVSLARRAAAKGVRRLIFISSVAVFGRQTLGRPFRHDDTPRPETPYAVAKLYAEQGLRQVAAETGLEVVIIRPPLILGRGGKGTVALLSRLVSWGLPTPFGLTRNRRDVVSLPTICDLIERCIAGPFAGRTLLVSDGRPLSTREVIDRVAELNGQRKPLHLPAPPAVLIAGLAMLRLNTLRAQLFGDLEVEPA